MWFLLVPAYYACADIAYATSNRKLRTSICKGSMLREIGNAGGFRA